MLRMPTTDAGWVSFSATLAAAYAASPTVYGGDEVSATKYTVKQTAYATAFGITQNPAARTTVTVLEKNAALRELKTATYSIADIARAQPEMTPELLAALGLSPRKEPEPRPIPSEEPSVDVLRVTGSRIEVHAHGHHTVRRGLPRGVKGVNFFTFVGAQPPDSLAEWFFQGASTRSKATLELGPSATGRTVWVTCAFFNDRSQSGPAATPFSVQLPASGVVPVTADMKIAA